MCVWTWCSDAATLTHNQSNTSVMFSGTPEPIYWHKGLHLKKEDTMVPITLLLPLSLLPFLSFKHCLALIFAVASFSVWTMLPLSSPTYLSFARTLSSPSHYVVSIRFVDGLICMKTRGQKTMTICHTYCLVRCFRNTISPCVSDDFKHLWCVLLFAESAVMCRLHFSF